MTRQWVAFLKRLRSYFKAYGGWQGVLKSPLFLIALLITGLNYSQWIEPFWLETTKTLIPSLLGFSLGTYAILFSLINMRLKGALRVVSNDNGISYLEVVNAAFFHFIFMQVIALTWAFLFSGSLLTDTFEIIKTYYLDAMTAFAILRGIGSFIGYLLLMYSILLTIGAAQAVYRLALIKDPAENMNGAPRDE